MSIKTLTISAENYLTNEKDDGRRGKAFECYDKIAMRSTRSSHVTSNQKNFDYQRKGLKIESKTRCGVIGEVKADGTVSFAKTLKADIVRYSPTADLEDVYTLTAENFIEVIKACGLVKVNKSRGTVNIQTFYNSRKREAQFRAMLEAYSF